MHMKIECYRRKCVILQIFAEMVDDPISILISIRDLIQFNLDCRYRPTMQSRRFKVEKNTDKSAMKRNDKVIVFSYNT